MEVLGAIIAIMFFGLWALWAVNKKRGEEIGRLQRELEEVEVKVAVTPAPTPATPATPAAAPPEGPRILMEVEAQPVPTPASPEAPELETPAEIIVRLTARVQELQATTPTSNPDLDTLLAALGGDVDMGNLTEQQAGILDRLVGGLADILGDDGTVVGQAEYRELFDGDVRHSSNLVKAVRGGQAVRGLQRVAERSRRNQVQGAEERQVLAENLRVWRGQMEEIRQGPPKLDRSALQSAPPADTDSAEIEAMKAEVAPATE